MMNIGTRKKRVSKAEWLELALETLEKDGIDKVKIEHLAKRLNVARSGFYWHFENRQALIRAMIEYWEAEFTSVVVSNSRILKSEPRQRLYKTMKMIVENNLTRFEIQMRAIAETDPVAMEIVNRVYKKRLDFIRTTLSELGFEGNDLEMRTHLFVCYHTWEGVMYIGLSKAKRKRWIQKRLDLLCTMPIQDDHV